MQTQEDIRQRISAAEPERRAFVKDQPIPGWRLTEDRLDALPAAIRDRLGGRDTTEYDESYLQENQGSIVALQMTPDGPDFYVVGRSTYEESYVDVPLAEVFRKNGELMERLRELPDVAALFEDGDPHLVGARKTTPVEMISMADIGFDPGEEVTLESPWGRQTKPSGRDAFLVHEEDEDRYYLVNADENGLPTGYAPHR